MNTITGRITVRETGTGIPDLLVVIYDLDPGTRPEEILADEEHGVEATILSKIQGDRLGSVLTDGRGQFQLSYEDGDYQVRNKEKRPDLMLLVLAPESAGEKPCAPVLHVSCAVRQNAGRTESYLIRLPQERLVKIGLAAPEAPSRGPDSSARVLSRMAEERTRADKVAEGLRTHTKSRIDKVRTVANAFEARLRPPILNSLSHASEALRRADNFVASGESVAAKTKAIIKKGIESVVNDSTKRARVIGHILLTDEQKQKLNPYRDATGDFKNVPGDLVDGILLGRNGGPQVSALLLRENPLERMCRDESHDEQCAAEHLDLEEAPSEHESSTDSTGAGAPIEAATSDDVPVYIARIMAAGTAAANGAGTGGDADAVRKAVQDLQGRVNELTFQNGPADTPAFYDFYNLQIAFEHVWQEAIDAGVLNLASDAFRTIVECGGDVKPVPDSRWGWLDGIKGALAELVTAAERAITPEVLVTFDLTQEQWNVLSASEQDTLTKIARNISISSAGIPGRLDTISTAFNDLPDSLKSLLKDKAIRSVGDLFEFHLRQIRSELAQYRAQGERIVKLADHRLVAGTTDFSRLHTLLAALEQRVKEAYVFTVYAASKSERSVNFGILVNYRQRWAPTNYQAGRLIKTIPLAPKEARKFSKKVSVKRSRAEKELENSLRSRRTESTETSRAESEIVRKALAKTNFQLTAEGTYNVGISKGEQTTSFGKDAETTSEEIKKNFREAVLKAAEEYKNERTVEINTSTAEDVEAEETGEISNPNDELTVTYLFYELQRRYQVSEQIHRLTPVVLVAQEVPGPHEIDEDWLITHDWILHRVLLDDTFRPALAYLATRVVGDEVALQELRRNVQQQRRIVDGLKDELVLTREQVGRRYAALERSVEKRASAAESDGGGFFGSITKAFTGVDLVEKGLGFLGGDDDSPEAARIREDAAKDAYERAANEERDAKARLEREVTALNAMTENYTKNLAEHLNRKAQIARLRVHVKQNILYYMQAIWAHEHTDHRFFRLHKVEVPVFKALQKTYFVAGTPDLGSFASIPFRTLVANKLELIRPPAHRFEVVTKIEPNLEFRTLAEVADLDNLLGYKGNYMIFPLKESNALTDFMMAPYVNQALGLHDPDAFGDWTLEDFSRYVCCLREQLTDAEFAKVKDQLLAQYKELLSSPQRNGEEIIVPTGALFIEALPGKHPILEDFKLMHRALDVEKAREEVHNAALENVRAAARLLVGEREDPSIERKIVVEGGIPGVVVPVPE